MLRRYQSCILFFFFPAKDKAADALRGCKYVLLQPNLFPPFFAILFY